MAITQVSDFIGEYKVSTKCHNDLQVYIDKFEKEYLIKLLGCSLYDLFIADLTANTPQVPQAQRFINIFDAFCIDEDCDIVRSEGIKQMLVQFIYFHYMRDQLNTKLVSGVARSLSETSDHIGYNGFNLIQSYNEGISNAWAIQWYICENETDYPEENTQAFYLMSLI